MSDYPPPEGLSTKRQALWVDVHDNYQLEAHHRELLVLLCQALDRADDAEAAIAEHGLLVEGRYGLRANPAVAIRAQAEAMAARLTRELQLDATPDPARLPRWVSSK